MTEEEKKAIERAEFLVSIPTYLEKDMCKNLLNYIDKLQKELDLKDKVINYIAKHTYIRTGENGVLGTITEEVIEHLYKKVEEENVKD